MVITSTSDETVHQKLELWAAAVMKHAKMNYELKGDKEGPREYARMKHEIAQAQQYLAFIPDDTAPHGFVMLYKR